MFQLAHVNRVRDLTLAQRQRCAHGRRVGAEEDYVFWGDPKESGRFQRALPIGEFRDRAYRVRRDLLDAWGGLTVNNGSIQRSARPPFFKQPSRFLKWLAPQLCGDKLLHEN
jgi:hypothetical protein